MFMAEIPKDQSENALKIFQDNYDHLIEHIRLKDNKLEIIRPIKKPCLDEDE